MVFTLGTLFEAGLLLVNAVAILNEEKFLKKSESANHSLYMSVIKLMLTIFIIKHTCQSEAHLMLIYVICIWTKSNIHGG